jgi:hypothetical protein
MAESPQPLDLKELAKAVLLRAAKDIEIWTPVLAGETPERLRKRKIQP